MIEGLNTSLIGMKASLDQLETTGQLMANLVKDNGDMVRDMVQLSVSQHTFSANAKMAQAADEAVGATLDMLI